MAMVVNEPVRHVKFISYTGEYPNLCSGVLVLEIDDEVVTFGDTENTNYPSFWESGGKCFWKHGNIRRSEWKIDCASLPIKYQQYVHEIDKVFNDNVEEGCCGGCL